MKSSEIKLIDAHGHVKWWGYDADRLVANMDEHGIDVMWLETWECPEHEIDPQYYGIMWPGQRQMPLADVMEAVGRYPDRFVPFYAPDPRQPHALRLLQDAVKHLGVRGYGELKCRVMMDDPHALEIFHWCGENGLPVVFHLDIPLPPGDRTVDPGYWYCCDWENLAKALETCPKTVFLGHAPGFWREISGSADDCPHMFDKGPVTPDGKLIRYLDRYPNLYCDLSAGSGYNALSRDPEQGKSFLLKYQDRCLFGRDQFSGDLYEFIESCEFEEAVRRKLHRDNALRLVPLDGGGTT